jgi:preprotein translocase subunit SecY
MASAAEQLAANMNFGSFQKATELHKRIWFTLIALIVYRLGTYVPIPGINPEAFAAAFSQQSKGILGMFNMFSGGAVQRMAVFSLNVMPYISASIIVQLMGSVYPPWEKLKKEGGEAGRKTLNQYTRYLAVVLAVVQSFSIAVGLQQPGRHGRRHRPGLLHRLDRRGPDRRHPVPDVAGRADHQPRRRQRRQPDHLHRHRLGPAAGRGADVHPGADRRHVGLRPVRRGVLAVAVIFAIVFIERSQRRLLVHYPKRQQGNRMIGGDTSFIPLKLNTAGVIPPIFASSLLLLPTTAMGFLATANLPNWLQWLPTAVGALQHGQPLFMVLYAALIIFFSFFYTSVVFNPDETAENLRKYGGFMPGIRPGKRTAEYLDYVLTRLTVIGAAYITAVCILPEVLMNSMGPTKFTLGGTSILIVVTVTMDTVAQIQSHLLAHQYEGLIKKSKLRGGKGR